MNKILKYASLLVITVIIIGGILVRKSKPNIVANVLEPVSVVSKVTSKKELKNTDGRTNILLLGIDGRTSGQASVGSKLTDTILLVSIDKDAKRPVMVSIPRDLWIKEYKSKINGIYPLCMNTNAGKEDPNMCIDRVKDTVEHVTGVPIHYYAILGFTAFRDAIETAGGVDVNVEEAFDDYKYPIEGKENAQPESARYKHVHFDKGVQHLNSEQALEYARSRHSTNYKQAGDFARARRQQQVVLALKDQLLSSDILLNPVKIKELYNSYKENVKTDITLGDAMAMYDTTKALLKNDGENSPLGKNVVKIVLSDEGEKPEKPGSGMLIVPNRNDYGGKWVLVAKDVTFDQIHGYIRQMMFEPVTEDNISEDHINPDGEGDTQKTTNAEIKNEGENVNN